MSSEGHNDGYILPIVLTYLLVMSMITTVVFKNVSQVSQQLSDVSRNLELDVAMRSAEAEAVFTLLSSRQGINGYIVPRKGVQQEDLTQDPFDFEQSIGESKNIWLANGEVRATHFNGQNIFVELRDINGLLSLNSVNRQTLTEQLIFMDIKSKTAELLASRLVDYRDADSVRGFLGAERSDYKARGLRLPSNRPFQFFEELEAVLGWGQLLDKDFTNRLIDIFTLQYSQSLNEKFVHDSIYVNNYIEPNIMLGSIVSGKVRLTFHSDMQVGDGYFKKIVEYDLAKGFGGRPYSKFFVYEGYQLTGRKNEDDFASVY